MAPTLLPLASFLDYVRRFGPLAFFAVGLVDQSIIPLPGSMDALLIFFVASKPDLWWYYVLMATAGSTVGAYVTYRISMKEGKEALEKRIGKKRADKAYHIFDRWGFWSVFIGTILPPPFPIVPFIASAGVMQYPRHLFLLSYSSGRMVRFTIVAWITKIYGKSLFSFFSQYYKPALYSLIGLAVVGALAGLWYFKYYRKKHHNTDSHERRAA
jgi:membrane protein YqaA with SNARE-associated domain